MAIYKELDAWQAAMSLVAVCYAATQKYPREEIFGITSQLRRGYLEAEDLGQVTDLCTKTGQLLNGLYRSLER